MDVFEYAMQTEKDGEEFYRRLVQQTTNKGLKTILTMLADDEVKHYNALKEMQTEKPDMPETTILSGAKNIFVQIRDSGEDFDLDIKQIDLYREAQDIEQKSRNFYLQKADETTDETQRDVFLKLADEEKKHYSLLDNIIEFVSRPERWLENAEFYHLEEY
jgi:rubrerythrin